MSYDNINSTFSAGLIGGVTATLDVTSGSSNQGDTGCEHLNVTSIQTSITAAMSISAAQNHQSIAVGAFKAAAATTGGAAKKKKIFF